MNFNTPRHFAQTATLPLVRRVFILFLQRLFSEFLVSHFEFQSPLSCLFVILLNHLEWDHTEISSDAVGSECLKLCRRLSYFSFYRFFLSRPSTEIRLFRGHIFQ